MLSGYKNMEETQYLYSKKLRIKAKRIFEERSGKKLSMGEVDMCLDRLGRLGFLFAKMMSKKSNEEIEKMLKDAEN